MLHNRSATPSGNRLAGVVIGVVSVLIPLVVTVLLYSPAVRVSGFDPYVLPLLNVAINSVVSVLLVAGYVCIRKGLVAAHRVCMVSSFCLSAVFLVSYVVYHATAVESKFGGEGAVRYVYFGLLISHILLAAAIVPMVLFTLYYAVTKNYRRHKKLARFTFPLWLYVSVTGVLVYLMISPYYPH